MVNPLRDLGQRPVKTCPRICFFLGFCKQDSWFIFFGRCIENDCSLRKILKGIFDHVCQQHRHFLLWIRIRPWRTFGSGSRFKFHPTFFVRYDISIIMYRFGLLPRLDPDSIRSVDPDGESGSMRQKWPTKIREKKISWGGQIYVHIIVLQVTHLAVKQTSGGFICWLVSILSQGNYQTSLFYFVHMDVDEDCRPGRKFYKFAQLLSKRTAMGLSELFMSVLLLF